MRIFIEICSVFAFLVVCRFWYVEGYNDANFDAENANKKIQMCHEVLAHGKIR